MFTELSLGCLLSGHRNLSMYQVFLHIFCQLHAHTCPLYNVLLEVVCCCFSRNNLFTKHDYIRWVTELHLSTKFLVCQCSS